MATTPEALDALEAADRFATVRNRLRAAAAITSEWAGFPMPMEDERLVISPSYPFADAYRKEGVADDSDLDPAETEVVNLWWSRRLRKRVGIARHRGRLTVVFDPTHSIDLILRTIGVAPVWGVEQEGVAVSKLVTLVSHHAFETYMLTGAILETSPRSGIAYIFRRLRPTIAISMSGDSPRVLCALCMHPIGYYAESHSGAMCPTDDVIAHLMLMRGDEPMFWRRSNQHPPDWPEVAIA